MMYYSGKRRKTDKYNLRTAIPSDWDPGYEMTPTIPTIDLEPIGVDPGNFVFVLLC